MKNGIWKKIKDFFRGKSALSISVLFICVLLTSLMAIIGIPSIKSCISDNSKMQLSIDRRAVLNEVQGACDELHGVLACREMPWWSTNSAELQYANRITVLFVTNPSLVLELQKLYKLLSVGKTHAEKIRQILQNKEARLSDTISLENAIRRVLTEADRVGPLLAAEVGGTWQKLDENLTDKQRCEQFLTMSGAASGNVRAK